METTQGYYVLKIKEYFSLRQRHNPHYSLRAYARDIGVHPATLSQILKGKRPLPMKNVQEVMTKMNLGPKERTLFMESILKMKMSLDQIKVDDNDDRFMLDESYHKVIAECEHFALLELYNVKDFDPTVAEITQRLGITENRAEVVIANLMTAALLKHDETGKLIPTHAALRTTEDVRSQALRESHKEALEMGKYKLDEIEVELRDFSSTTVAVDLKKLPEAKAIIREFRQKMAALLRDGNKTDVFQLAIQLYPLTTTATEKN